MKLFLAGQLEIFGIIFFTFGITEFKSGSNTQI